MKRQLHTIIKAINNRFRRERQSCPEARYHHFIINFPYYAFDCFITDDCAQVDVLNPLRCGQTYENISRYIESRITAWDDVEIEKEPDYWNAHGFASEADYNRYRYAI